MEVDYPASNGDYRIKYTDTEHTGVGTSYARFSRVINKRANGVDTVSFFIATDKTPTFAIEYITGITNEGVISWSPVAGKSVTTTAVNGAKVYNIRIEQDADGNITSAAVIGAYTGNYYIRTDCASSQWNNYRYDPGNLMTYSEYAATKTGSDYTHYFMAHANAGTNVKFVIANDYSAYLTDTLYQSSYRVGDASHVTAAGALNAEANIRFMWDMRDNKVIRAYLAAAKSDGSKFLVLQGTSGNIADENGITLSNANGNNHGAGNDAIQFIDKENWIYETTVQVVPSSFVKLYAVYNDATFYYYGNEGGFDKDHAIQLVTGSGSAQKVKVVYDFKTDRLVAAWQPPVSAIGSSTSINADVMLVRNHQDAGQNIRFTESGALTDVKTVYGVMQFNRWTLSNRDGANDVDPNHCKTPSAIATYHPLLPANEMKSDYERFNYFISFPFDVNLNDVFGSVGTYGVHWGIEKYYGDERAKKGYWADSDGFWKLLPNTNQTLKAYEGYLLVLDLDYFGYSNTTTWTSNLQQIELYFPSASNAEHPIQIATNDVKVEFDQTDYICTIDRRSDADKENNVVNINKDRRIADSYWHVIGVPSFSNVSHPIVDGDGAEGDPMETNPEASTFVPRPAAGANWQPENKLYLYTWRPADNSYVVETSGSSFTFKPMHAYMVQYGGDTLMWRNASEWTSQVPARTRKLADYDLKLELRKANTVEDHTLMNFSYNEGITNAFEFNHDLFKEMNGNKGNIWTVTTDGIPVAGNSMPFSENTTIVPVGVKIATNGEYTFAVPGGTEGVGVTLVDYVTGTRTQLGALDYTVNLNAGEYADRFFLEISPIQQMPTGVDLLNGENGANGVRKVMIDGLLYIVKDGEMFDARGNRVK